MTVGEIAEHFAIARPTLSAHFAVLREADLVEPEKVGSLSSPGMRRSGFAETVGVGLGSSGRLKLSTWRAT
jgi:DNA-binding transcriptional ArsR family regulator